MNSWFYMWKKESRFHFVHIDVLGSIPLITNIVPSMIAAQDPFDEEPSAE
jgi:hypothetical protein